MYNDILNEYILFCCKKLEKKILEKDNIQFIVSLGRTVLIKEN